MAKVMIIDDSDFDRQMIRKVIAAAARDQEVAFTELPSGLEAVNVAETEQPNLVVLDVRMPGMDGFEVLRNLRSHARTRPLPIIMLSGSDRDMDRLMAEQNKATAYYVKPAKMADYFSLGQGLFKTYLSSSFA